MTCRRIVEMMNECHMSYRPAMIALFVITAGCLAE
jgi:hypothetical protein